MVDRWRDESSAMSLELNSFNNRSSEEMPSSIQGTESLMQLMTDLSMEMNVASLDGRSGNSRLLASTIQSSIHDDRCCLQNLSVETIPLSGLDVVGNTGSNMNMSFSQGQQTLLTVTSLTPPTTKPVLAYPNLVQSTTMLPPPSATIFKDGKPPQQQRPSHRIMNVAPLKVEQEVAVSSRQLIPPPPANVHDVTTQLDELERAVMEAIESGDSKRAEMLLEEQAKLMAVHQELLHKESNSIAHSSLAANPNVHGDQQPQQQQQQPARSSFIKITNGPPSDPSAYSNVDCPGDDHDRPDTLYILATEATTDSLACYLDIKKHHERFKTTDTTNAVQRKDLQKILRALVRRYQVCGTASGQALTDSQAQVKVWDFLQQPCWVDFDPNRDVLKGKGGHGRYYPGNQNYLAERNRLVALYAAAPMGDEDEKARVALQLVQSVYQTGGRFVIKCHSTNDNDFTTPGYCVLETAVVVKKAKQALRDGRLQQGL
jgi:hypothetical protein